MNAQAVVGAGWSFGRSTNSPFTHTAPARTNATRCGALAARHQALGRLDQLERDRHRLAASLPLVTFLRCQAVAKTDSIGFVVSR